MAKIAAIDLKPLQARVRIRLARLEAELAAAGIVARASVPVTPVQPTGVARGAGLGAGLWVQRRARRRGRRGNAAVQPPHLEPGPLFSAD